MRAFRLGQKAWEKATVVKRYDKRSYEVETDTGSYRRNRVDLKQQQPTPQMSTVISEPAPDTIMNQDPTTAKPNNEVKTSQSTSQPQELHQDSPSTVSQRPKSTSRSPAYLKDCVHQGPGKTIVQISSTGLVAYCLLILIDFTLIYVRGH